jgi:tetratricopeptide (TPR) repeat protein
MAALAQLISAITFFVLVCGLLVLLYKPPKALQALRKLRIKDYFEGEFQPVAPQPAALPELTSDAGAAEPPPTATPETQAAAQAPPTEADDFSRIWDLLEDGKYREALDLAKQDVAKEKEPNVAVENEAFYLSLAFLKGADFAFGDLEKHANAHPGNCGAQYWFGEALSRAGRVDEALKAWRASLANTQDEPARVRAVRAIATALSKMELSGEGRVVLQQELTTLFIELAKTYESDKPPDHEKGFLMRELAIRSSPSDKQLRFKLAYGYADRDAHELALVHYRKLIQLDAGYGNAQNNAGVAADALSLPIASVTYYRAAEQLGETLPVANLAYKFIGAGFRTEAAAMLRDISQKTDVHRNVHLALGELARSETAEEKKIEQITERVDRVRGWRFKFAEALLRPTTTTDLSGTYKGVPSPLSLSLASDGTVEGTFSADGKPASLIGNVDGEALIFQWSEIRPEASTAWYVSLKSGHGVLLISGTALEGYWAEGSSELDAKNADSWKMWKLSKESS